ATPLKAPLRVKKGAIRPGIPSGKENIAPQPQSPHGAVPLVLTPPGKENYGPLLLSRPPEALPLPWTPVPPGPWGPGHWLPPGLSMPPPVPQGPPNLPHTCSTLILQSCGTPDSLLLQPQAPGASCLAWTSGPSERQLQREAAEALVGLKDSSQAPRLTPSVPPNPAWISLLHPCGPPAPPGGRGFQPVGPPLRPSPGSSVSLHIGRLGSISLLS
ncbi:UNVERIFIED_CONTAM: Doublesex- and mab-3-related transcription factor C2, partial [Eudyptes pachyrhynchus]